MTEGLELGGNTDLTTRATVFLALLLNKMARDYDWPELLVLFPFTLTKGSEVLDISALTDFKVPRKLRLDTTNEPLYEAEGGYPELLHLVEEEKLNGSEGQPRVFAVAPDKQSLIVHPIPNSAFTGDLLYYSIPDAPTADTETPWMEDTMLLTLLVAEFSKLHDQEMTLAQFMGIVTEALVRARQNALPRGRDSAVKIRRDPRHYPRIQIDQG